MTATHLAGPAHPMARHAWKSILITGVAAAVLGLLILAWPGPTLVVAGVLLGVYLVISGVLQLFAAFGPHVTAGMRVLAFLSGILSLMLGFFCFRSVFESVLLLALWIGIGWLFRGVTLLIAALSDPASPSRVWQAVFGLVIAAGGAVLIVSPFDSISVLTVLTGWWLIVIGVMEAFTAFQVRKSTDAPLPAG
ncbi:HdeD family acid-resistance protein [Nocardia sp. NBC_01327]|uniref:HdeD family acid-resistance protein n=1 Tax=Nocardia sp. NBC_01327 TaxID=2903593 RepID=UPI002E1441CC|nr:HdeD family acid-resistance protein [Nocardia sp. NBC_01327]